MRQRGMSDCVIASLATVLGLRYEEVKARFGRVAHGGMSGAETEWLLDLYGDWDYYLPRRRLTVRRWAAEHPRYQALAGVYGPDENFRHVLAVKGGRVFDPGRWGPSQERCLLRFAFVLRKVAGRPLSLDRRRSLTVTHDQEGRPLTGQTLPRKARSA